MHKCAIILIGDNVKQKTNRRTLRTIMKFFHGSLVKYKKGSTVFYRKEMSEYFLQFPLKYAKVLSNELDIPMINYRFIKKAENRKYLSKDSRMKQYYFLSTDYDKSIPDYKYIDNPFNINLDDLSGIEVLNAIDDINIDDIIGYMKEFCSNYENGKEIYDEYLKQILLSFFISDPDRNFRNIRLYKKGNQLKLAPYFDIDFIFSVNRWSIGAEDLVTSYVHYLPPDEMQKWCDEYNNDPSNIKEGSVYTIERINSEFDDLFERCYDDLYIENIYSTKDNYHWDDLFQLIYDEISDKSIFDKIHKLDYEALEEKYNLDMPRNARIMIYNLFKVRKEEFDKFYKKIKKDL